MSLPPSAPPAFNELKARLAKVDDLGRARSVLEWDARTMMPPAGASARFEQIATLERARHERFVDDEVGRLLDEVRPYEESIAPDSDDASLIRVARRDWEKARRVPAALNGRIALAEAKAEHAWLEARRRSDFSLLAPNLEETLALKREYIKCFDVERPYDALLDDFEPDATTAEIAPLLEELKTELLPLEAAISELGDVVDDSCLRGHFPTETQERLCLAVARELPLPPQGWRLDRTTHPFLSAFSIRDLRITTRYDEGHLTSALLSMLHETGHALYESGIDPEYERTPLGDAVSLGLHESQSRLWENQVGRSLPFWRRFFPLVRDAFPDQLGDLDVEAIYRAVNKVEPSLIRVEADEVTYNLHVILRFELEQELVEGRLAVGDLPEAWNARVKDYLGLEVPNDAAGVLQDVHWAAGLFGYFPTYSLGTILSAQIWEAARAAMPNLYEQIEAGKLGPLREWLRENLHRHGRKLTTAEAIERVAGGPIEVGPYLRYLRGKAREIYGLEEAPVGERPG